MILDRIGQTLTPLLIPASKAGKYSHRDDLFPIMHKLDTASSLQQIIYWGSQRTHAGMDRWRDVNGNK